MPHLISRKNLEVHCIQKDKYGPMGGLLLAEDGVISTNGKMLMVTKYPEDEVTEHPSYPEGDESPSHDHIIPEKSARKLLAMLPKKPARPILAHAVVHGGEQHKVRVTCTDLNDEQSLKITTVDGEFPPTSQDLESARKNLNAAVCLSVEILETLVKAAKKGGELSVELAFDIDQFKTCNEPLKHYASAIPFTLYTGSKDTRTNTSGVVMPLVPSKKGM